MTLLSVILPNYNYGRYINESLNSILNTNTSDEYEIVVVDDGSTDNSRAVLREYDKDKRVRIFYQSTNRGAAESFNYGVLQARGAFLHFFSSDDVHEGGAIDFMINKIKEFPYVNLFTSAYTTFDNSGATYIHRFPFSQSFSYFDPNQVMLLFRHTHFWISGHAIFFKKGLWLKKDPQMGPACDWLNNHILALQHGIGYFSESLVKVRNHPQAYSAHINQHEKRKMWLYLLGLFEKKPKHYELLIRSGICRMLGLKAIYLELLKTPKYWKYLFPMVTRELERKCFGKFFRLTKK